MKCIRCGIEFNKSGTNICGSCADDLRQEEYAIAEAKIEETRTLADQMNREAYEERLADEQADSGQGYRYS
jgi:hypothetical protein